MSAAAVPYLQRGPGRAEDGRRGKVFSIRIGDEDRTKLAALAHAAIGEMGWSYERRQGSMGGFLVWAALQWQPKDKTIVAPKRRRSSTVVPRRRRGGTTRLQGKKRGKKGGRK